MSFLAAAGGGFLGKFLSGLAVNAFTNSVKIFLNLDAKDPVFIALAVQIDSAFKIFVESHPDFSSVDNSFMARQTNMDAIIQSLNPAQPALTFEMLDPRGYENVRDATKDELIEFVTLLQNEIKKNHRLADLLEDKEFRMFVRSRLSLLSDGSSGEIKEDSIDTSSAFAAHVQVVGHLSDEDGRQRALYLDEKLYVHRLRPEQSIYKALTEYQDRGTGRWVSIVGDAGHGKTCLLWYIHQDLRHRDDMRVVAVQAHLLPKSDMEAQLAALFADAKSDEKPTVLLLDTLDLILGLNDAAIAKVINDCRAQDCLLITTCRRSEEQRLSEHISPDERIPLERYSEEEAQSAIRNYVNAAYPSWTDEQRNQQYHRVYDLLDQRRQVRELDFQPLILRMIFEAYVPRDIPQDVNTRLVYDQFWRKKVLQERTERPADRRNAAMTCFFIARLLAFGELGNGDTLSLAHLFENRTDAEIDMLQDSLARLISNGVIEIARNGYSIRFFHQTFFEYSCARWLLEGATAEERDELLPVLFKDVEDHNFFRVPILKQLMLLASDTPAALESFVNSVREIDSDFAASVLLEVNGKCSSSMIHQTCLDWIRADSEKLAGVVAETVKFYPRARIAAALELFGDYVNTPMETLIYASCRDAFAPIAPDDVNTFLSKRLIPIRSASDDAKTYYKDALIAAWGFGADGALDSLASFIPSLKLGQQIGAIERLDSLCDIQNASSLLDFSMRVLNDHGSKHLPWVNFHKLLVSISSHFPDEVSLAINHLIENGYWRQGSKEALFVGRLAGVFIMDEDMLSTELPTLLQADHMRRLYVQELGHLGAGRFPDTAYDYLISLDPSAISDMEQVRSIFRVASGLKDIPASRSLDLIDRWQLPDGLYYTFHELLKYIAETEPATLAAWLHKEIGPERNKRLPLAFAAFKALAESDPASLELDDLPQLRLLADRQPDFLTDFAATLGNYSSIHAGSVSSQLADLLVHRSQNVRRAAAGTLKAAAADSPSMVLSLGDIVMGMPEAAQYAGARHALFEALREIPETERARALDCITQWFPPDKLQHLSDEKLSSEILINLKLYAPVDPGRVLQLAGYFSITTSGIAGAMGALLNNLPFQPLDQRECESVLEIFMKLSPYAYQKRLRYALPNAFRKLQPLLPHRYIVDAFFNYYRMIENPKSLRILLLAVTTLPCWTDADSKRLLADDDFPGEARAILIT